MLSGDFQKLDRWAKAIGELESPRLRFKVADEMSDGTLGFIVEGFGREADRFGKAWAPKKRPDGNPILRGKTGRLSKFRKGAVSPSGYRVGTNAEYFKYHQRGTRRMKARRMVPNRRLPPRWVSEFRDIYSAAMRSELRAITGGGSSSRIRAPRSRAA